MKVGDLVKLSAYAKNLKNYYVGRDDDVGIVYDIPFFNFYSVRWASDGATNVNMDRRDLVYAKIEK